MLLFKKSGASTLTKSCIDKRLALYLGAEQHTTANTSTARQNMTKLTYHSEQEANMAHTIRPNDTTRAAAYTEGKIANGDSDMSCPSPSNFIIRRWTAPMRADSRWMCSGSSTG